MARRLNWLGKLVVLAVVIVILMGGYFGGKFLYNHLPTDLMTGFAVTGGGVNAPEALMSKFTGAVNNKTYADIFGMLSNTIPKSVTEAEFAAKLAAKFGNTSLVLEKISTEGEEGFAVLSAGSEYMTIPIIRENKTWKINYFAAEARCNNACAASVCKDDKILIECKDTNNDSCTEKVEKTCDIVCSDNACSAVRQNFILKPGSGCTTTTPLICLIDIESNSANFNVGDELVSGLRKGSVKTVEGLKITVNEVGSDTVSIKVVPA